MPQASYVQTSFRGGEWAPESQGALHDQLYKAALDTCQNYIVLEEDSLSRRPGLKFVAPTKAGGVARNWTYKDSQLNAYNVEAGGGYFRFYKSRGLLLDAAFGTVAVSSITTDTPAKVNTATNHNLTSGQYVVFSSLVGGAILRNRQFVVTVTSPTQFTIADPMSGSFVGTAVSGFVSGNIQRVYEITSPYDSGEIFGVYVLQDQLQQLMLHKSVAPTLLTKGTGDTFSTSIPTLTDGPYLDPPTDGSTLTPDAITGTITLTASATTSINGGQGFLVTDVGRAVRLFSEPAAWASGTTYSKNALVKYNGAYYVALKGSNTGNRPDTSFNNWAIAPTAATWVWGTISHFTDATHVVITTKAFDDGSTPSLLSTNAIAVWQLGLYSNTTGWPTCGVFHEGRLWLASVAYPNRFDGSKVDNHFDFTPTSPDGTVADDNAVSVVAESDDANPAYWFSSSLKGLIVGTDGGEWMISASQLDDPITPTSIQIRRYTKFGCANIRPAEAPTALAVVHRQQRKIFEYKWFIDTSAYSIAPNAVPLSLRARHLMETGIAQVEYMADPFPVIWGRRNDGLLVGCTYLRNPQQYMAAWHKHPLGGGTNLDNATVPAQVQSMAVVPSPDGLTEDLWCVVGRKIPGIVAPDATPNPPIQPTQTIIDPIFVDSNGAYEECLGIQKDEASGNLYISTLIQGGEHVGLAVYGSNGTLVQARQIDWDGTGTGYSASVTPPPYGIAWGGQYVVGCKPETGLNSCSLFVLKRSDLTWVRKVDGLAGPFPSFLCVSGSETYAHVSDKFVCSIVRLSDGALFNAIWTTMGTSAPSGVPQDGQWSDDSTLWVANGNGTIDKYSVSGGVSVSKVSTITPHADGVLIRKIQYNPAHNHLLIWYANGRFTRWDITGSQVNADFTFPYIPTEPSFEVGQAFNADKTNWRNEVVYTQMQTLGSPVGQGGEMWFFNATNGNTQVKQRNFWPIDGFSSLWQDGQSSYMDTNNHTLWASRLTAGVELLSYDVGDFAVDDIGKGDGTIHYMEFMSPYLDFSETDPKLAMFADSGRQDSDDASAVTVSGRTVTIVGLHYLEGETIAVHANGVDCGNVTVLKGQIQFTPPSAVTFTVASDLSITLGYAPTAIGALLPQAEVGGANGPSYFKTRRNHKYALLLNDTQGISVTEDGRDAEPDQLLDEVTNLKVVAPALFSGRARENVSGGDYSFRGKITWKQDRLYPGTILAVGGFFEAYDV